MQLVSFAITHYVAIPYEKFTDKVIAALAIFQVIQRKGDNEELDNDELEVLWFEENCHPKLMVPIYVLDRCINPSKSEFKSNQNKITFDTNISDPDNRDLAKQITLTENQIQYFLCMCIRRVNDIVMKNVKSYSEEIPIPDLGEVDESPGLGFENV